MIIEGIRLLACILCTNLHESKVIIGQLYNSSVLIFCGDFIVTEVNDVIKLCFSCQLLRHYGIFCL